MRVDFFRAAVASLALALTCSPALAQTYSTASAVGGTQGAVSMTAPWSALSITGTPGNPCRDTTSGSTGTASLTNQFVQGDLYGLDGGSGGPFPLITRNFATTSYTNNNITVPAGGINMHPGNSNECAVLRFTTPVGGAGYYSVSATFTSIDVVVPTFGNQSNIDGVTGLVLRNGAVIGGSVSTYPRGDGRTILQDRVLLCPGHTIDFAVHMNGNYSYDSTLLSGEVRRTGNISLLDCPLVVDSATSTVGSTGLDLNTGAWGVDDLITMVGTPNGPRSPCCAPWAGVDIIPALDAVFPTHAGGPYTLVFDPAKSQNVTLNAQMSAYLTYVNSLDPSITQITLTWQAVDLGVGTVAATSGTVIGAPQTLTWSLAGNVVTMTGGGFWTGAPFAPNSWIGLSTVLGHNGTQNSPYFAEDCIHHWRPFRVQVPTVRRGRSPSAAVFQSVDAQGRLVSSRPTPVQSGRPVRVINLLRTRN